MTGAEDPFEDVHAGTQDDAVQEVASALMRAPLWFQWCGNGKVWGDDGSNARVQAARVAVATLRALPVEERMEAMGMTKWQHDDLPCWVEVTDA